MRRTLFACLCTAAVCVAAAAGYRNERQTVLEVDRDYPGLIQTCGDFVDQVAHRLNRKDGVVRWGRKARQADGGNPNCDALAYFTDPSDRSRKILVDIIVASESPDARPQWAEYLGDNVGNGYWTEPVTTDRDAITPPSPPPPGPDLSGIERRLETLEAGHELILDGVATIEKRLAAVDAGQKAIVEGIAGTRQSLEEHRAAVREGKDTVLRWLKDWKNYLAIVAGILAGVGLEQ